MVSRPGERPTLVVHVGPRYSLRELVPARLVYSEIRLSIRRQFVRFIEDYQVLGLGLVIPKVAEHALPGQGV